MAAKAAAAAAAAGASGASDPPAPCDDSACSTPFVSAPSSPSRDGRDTYPAHFFFSAPTSPTRKDASGVLDFDFDFSSRFPSPSAAAMSSADELFHNGQIRPVRLAAALLQPHPADPTILLDFPPDAAAAERHHTADEQQVADAVADERGRVRSRSLRRKARSMSPFRTHWRTACHAPVPEPECAGEAQQTVATPAASRSSSSSSTASSASSASSSSSSSRGGSRRWGGFLKDLLHRSKSDGGKTTHHHQHSHHAAVPVPTVAAKPSASSPSPSPAHNTAPVKGRGGGTPGHHRGGGGRRKMSAHERLYEARRAEAEEMRRRTSLPYRQGLLLFGCIGLGNRSSCAGLARGLNAAAAVSSRS